MPSGALYSLMKIVGTGAHSPEVDNFLLYDAIRNSQNLPQTYLDLNEDSTISNSMAMRKLLNFAGPQFVLLPNGTNTIYLQGLL